LQHIAALAKGDATFSLHVAPDAAFAHPGWQRARASALAAVGTGGAVALVGPPGCGKTLLLHELARTLRLVGKPVRFAERGDAARVVPDAETVLLIDEAGRLGDEGLALFCAGPSPVVLAGLPGFEDRLAGLPRRITSVPLAPLSPEGVARFVASRLAAGAQPRDLIEPEAVLALARHSGGSLRLVNVIGGAAVFLARLEGAAHVSASHVAEAASMRDGMDGDNPVPVQETPGDEPGPSEAAIALMPDAPGRPVPANALRRRAMLGAGVAGLALIGGWAVRGRTGTPPEAPAPVVAALPPTPDKPVPVPDTQPERVAPTAPEPRGAVQATVQPTVPVAHQAPRVAARPAVFRGTIYNETMGQSGQLRIALQRQAQPGAVKVRFDASAGLVGSGELAGTLSDSGRLAVSGQLMMGRNAYDCDLQGTLAGGTLTGVAGFVRAGGSSVWRSSFRLAEA